MSISLKYIAGLKKSRNNHPWQPSWDAALNHLLLKGLSKQQRMIFEHCRLQSCSSRQIAFYMGISIYHASTLLKNLYDLGMVKRREYTNDEGRYFHWKATF